MHNLIHYVPALIALLTAAGFFVFGTTVAVQGIGSTLANGGTAGTTYTTVSQLKNIKFGGMTVDFDEITNLGSALFKEWMKTLVDAKEISFEGVFNPTDASQQSFQANIQTAGAAALNFWKVTTFDGSTFTFQGYASDYAPIVEYNKAILFSGKIKITGPITVVWS